MFKYLLSLALSPLVFMIPIEYAINTVNDKYKVIDGDTIVNTDTNIKMRLACIDAPELQQPFGIESKEYLKLLIKSNQLNITTGKTDKYGRKLAYIELENKRTVQEALVESGLAYVYHQYKKECTLYDTLTQLEQQAQQKKFNIWSSDFLKPWDFRRAKI